MAPKSTRKKNRFRGLSLVLILLAGLWLFLHSEATRPSRPLSPQPSKQLSSLQSALSAVERQMLTDIASKQNATIALLWNQISSSLAARQQQQHDPTPPQKIAHALRNEDNGVIASTTTTTTTTTKINGGAALYTSNVGEKDKGHTRHREHDVVFGFSRPNEMEGEETEGEPLGVLRAAWAAAHATVPGVVDNDPRFHTVASPGSAPRERSATAPSSTGLPPSSSLATAAATTMSGHHHQSTELLRGEYDWLVSKEEFEDAGDKRARSSPSSSSSSSSSSQFAASLPPREYTPKNASAQTTTTAGINVEPTPATGAEKVFEPIRLSPDDWLIYLRIQKTGSQTFWSTIQKEFRSDIWQAPGGGKGSQKQRRGMSGGGECPQRGFCGGKGKKGNTCQDVVTADARSILSSRGKNGGGPSCKFLFRGHINIFDYSRAFESLFVPPTAVKFITFLREPIARALSEYNHVTEGLVAQFGPETFGAAWDYEFFFDRKASLEDKRKQATLGAWLKCGPCRAGSSNRQARFLAGFATTGEIPDEEEKQTSSSRSALLVAALANLKRCTFVGIMERFEDSMLLLKHTFPSELRQFDSYTTSPHPYTVEQQKLSEKQRIDQATTITPALNVSTSGSVTSSYKRGIESFGIAGKATQPQLRKQRWSLIDKPQPSATVGGSRRGRELLQGNEVVEREEMAVVEGEDRGENDEEEGRQGGSERGNKSVVVFQESAEMTELRRLNTADSALYEEAQRLFEARFRASVTHGRGSDSFAVGERLGDRFLFEKTVTTRRKRNKVFHAKEYSLQPALKLAE